MVAKKPHLLSLRSFSPAIPFVAGPSAPFLVLERPRRDRWWSPSATVVVVLEGRGFVCGGCWGGWSRRASATGSHLLALRGGKPLVTYPAPQGHDQGRLRRLAGARPLNRRRGGAAARTQRQQQGQQGQQRAHPRVGRSVGCWGWWLLRGSSGVGSDSLFACGGGGACGEAPKSFEGNDQFLNGFGRFGLACGCWKAERAKVGAQGNTNQTGRHANMHLIIMFETWSGQRPNFYLHTNFFHGAA